MASAVGSLIEELHQLPECRLYGRVAGVLGLLVEVVGLDRALSVGSRCNLVARDGRRVVSEVIGFRRGRALLMPFGTADDTGLGCQAELAGADPVIRPTEAWLGRVVNALGQPLDGKGPLPLGRVAHRLHGAPPPAHRRQRVGGKMDYGVRVINTFLTCCRGQRMGIFSGSGVGKSILLSMLARYTASDVNVIGLVGERGREVQEWLEDDLGPEGLARSVVVVATSVEPPLMRRQAAYLTMTLAEFFRDRGEDVLCLMDSITRFAMSLRGILDGDVLLERSIAERNRYPAVNVLRSVSRTMPDCNSRAENDLVNQARGLLSTYEDMAEPIRIGAYKPGSDKAIDEAIGYYPRIEAFLAQDRAECSDFETAYTEPAELLGLPGLDIADPAAGSSGASATEPQHDVRVA